PRFGADYSGVGSCAAVMITATAIRKVASRAMSLPRTGESPARKSEGRGSLRTGRAGEQPGGRLNHVVRHVGGFRVEVLACTSVGDPYGAQPRMLPAADVGDETVAGHH